jgi:hypothetical protein
LGVGLSVARYALAGTANSGVAGYFAGGHTSSTLIDRFAFPSDTRTSLGTGLSVNRDYFSTASNEVV